MKYIFSTLLLFCVSLSFSQLSVNTLQGNTPINDGDIFTFNTTVFEDAKLKFKISNSSSTETINVLAEMVSMSNTDGTNCQFCVQPECFFQVSPGQTIPNNPIVLAPGADNGNFDYFSNSNPGDGSNYPMSFVLRIFMVDDNGNDIGGDEISITYQYSPNIDTQEFSLENMGITLHNTMVQDYLKIDNLEPVSFDVFDINSRRVESFSIETGQHELDLSDLSTGYYILLFNDKQGRSTNVKIQKR